ncbi:hypothetical protein [Sphingobacterium sp. E70]|uniref:hypothetical protein n=1 Tax=Sphingobacterium sp. E70 TaxID=2853439 RepID=UPI002795D758|nr:hypothetical protein [Sphingobacterium sp. E70]
MAPIRLDRGFLPQMIDRKTGVIIHIASIQGDCRYMIQLCRMLLQRQDCETTVKVYRMR